MRVNKFVINLDTRADRLALFDMEAKRIGIHYQRISATEGGAKGATLSHIEACKKAKENRLPYYYVFEDDCQFDENYPARLSECFEQLYDKTEDIDMIMLGYNHEKKPITVSADVSKVRYALCCHAMIVFEGFYDKLIETLENTDKPCDVALAEIQEAHNVYCFNPPLVWQRDGYSDIEKKEVSYPFLKTGSNQVHMTGNYFRHNR